MEKSCKTISVITPFYKGNRYINDLVTNVNAVAARLLAEKGVQMELIVVNDSPEVPVGISVPSEVPITVLNNSENMGIHCSRIRGIRQAQGEWIQMLDQDDLLIAENYPLQVDAAQNSDVVVGNCLYYFGEEEQLLYANKAVMQYYMKERRFLRIRNLIASPGHCLIRKDALPIDWLEDPMHVNGADDYFLWMLLFDQGARFALNERPVYIHRNSVEGNLSFDLEKMLFSCREMVDLLGRAPSYPRKKIAVLKRSVDFKYLYDTKKLQLSDWLRYADKVVDNGIYKAVTLWLTLTK